MVKKVIMICMLVLLSFNLYSDTKDDLLLESTIQLEKSNEVIKELRLQIQDSSNIILSLEQSNSELRDDLNWYLINYKEPVTTRIIPNVIYGSRIVGIGTDLLFTIPFTQVELMAGGSLIIYNYTTFEPFLKVGFVFKL